VFEVGNVYRRRDLHREYGGQRQGGIVTPASEPVIFVITGEGGEAHGYADRWDNDGTFRYFGEGQVGDMEFVRGNAAIRDHAALGKDLHLFEKVAPAHLRYRGQMVCAGYDLVPNSPDTAGNPRTAIVFRLVSLTEGANVDEQDDAGTPSDPLLGIHPPVAWTCNAYRRRYGSWPTRIRLDPRYAAGFFGELPSGALIRLATAFAVEITANEPSLRVTVIGDAGAVTYDDGVEEQDWNTDAFVAFLMLERPLPS
jgi:hypothetical protein